MALALRSSLSLQLLRYASPCLRALYRRPPSARLQLNAAATSSHQEEEEAAAGNDDIIAATTCAPLEVDAAAAAAAEQLATARTGALPCPHEERPSQPKEGSQTESLLAMSSPSPPGTPVEGNGGNGGAHH